MLRGWSVLVVFWCGTACTGATDQTDRVASNDSANEAGSQAGEDCSGNSCSGDDSASGGDGNGSSSEQRPSDGSGLPLGEPCEDVFDGFRDENGLDVDVVIANAADHTLYLAPETADCYPTRYFDIAGRDGTPLNLAPGCYSSCEDILNGTESDCPTNCAASEAIELPPGAIRLDTWNGTTLEEVTSLGVSVCQVATDSCWQRTVPEGDSFTLTVHASDAVDCSQGPTADCPACDGPTGDCRIPWALAAGTRYEAAVEFDKVSRLVTINIGDQ